MNTKGFCACPLLLLGTFAANALEPTVTDAQTCTSAMPSPAEQAAHDSGTGVPLLVAADADLVAKNGVAQDSWFVVAHLRSGSQLLDLMIHYIRLTPPQGGPIVQAIASVIDPQSEKYIAEEQDYPNERAVFSSERLEVRNPSGAFTGNAEAMHVTGDFARIKVDMMLSHQGPLLANVGTGMLPFYGDINYEYALPDMATTGTVTIDGKRYPVSGTSWFDRQWGQMAPRFWKGSKWTWMGISIAGGSRISLWDIFDNGAERAFATVLYPDGHQELADVEPLAKDAGDVWSSQATGRRYPTRWSVSIPSLKAHLEVVPRTREQEIVSPIMAHKYEGASTVSGSIGGTPASGYAIVEMVGGWK